MNEIREWLSSLSSFLLDDREMNTYSYEPISEIVSNEIELPSKSDRNIGVTSYLYFGLDEGKPYIKVVHNNNNRHMIKEERFMITSCYAESGHGAWFVEYQCENSIEFVFTRMFRIIEMVVKKNGFRRKYYEIDVKREPRFTLFNEKDVKSDMRDDLRDLYKFEELFEHAY